MQYPGIYGENDWEPVTSVTKENYYREKINLLWWNTLSFHVL